MRSSSAVLAYADAGTVLSHHDLLAFTSSPRVKEILVLQDGYQGFQQEYPFLCLPDALADKVYPANVAKGVFLSGEICSGDRQVLKDLNISYIVNVTREVQNKFEGQEENAVEYLRIPVNDSEAEAGSLRGYFAPVVDFIDKA